MNYSFLPYCGNRTPIFQPATVLYYFAHIVPFILTAGIVGNVLNLIVLNSGGMRSRTNIFLSCMALGDLIFLFLMSWMNLTQFEGPAKNDAFLSVYYASKMLVTFVANWFGSCSTWFAVAVTCERFIAVWSPLKIGQLLNRAAIVSSIILVMFMTFISWLHVFYWMHPVARPLCSNPNETMYFMVAFKRHHDPFRYDYVRISTALSGILNVIAPIVLLAVFNCLLIFSLYNSRKAVANLGQSSRSSQEHRVTMTVIVITVTAVILLTPSLGLAGLDISRFGSETRPPMWYYPFTYFSNFLVIVDKSLNFVLYCLSSQAFRRKLMNVLSRGRKKRQRSASSGSTLITSASTRKRSTVLQSPRITSSPRKINTNMNTERMELLTRK